MDKDNTLSEWAELIIPETAQPLAYYDHPFYGKYPAITSNRYGKGAAIRFPTNENFVGSHGTCGNQNK